MRVSCKTLAVKFSWAACQRSILVSYYIRWTGPSALRHGRLVLARSCQKPRTSMDPRKVSQTMLTSCNRASPRNPQPDYIMMHEFARHAIHSSETFAMAIETMTSLLREKRTAANGIHKTVEANKESLPLPDHIVQVPPYKIKSPWRALAKWNPPGSVQQVNPLKSLLTFQ